MQRGDPAVAVKPVLTSISDRVAAAVGVEDLLARERDLHRAVGDDRELGRGELVREEVALAAEAAADRRRDHADVARRQLEHLRQRRAGGSGAPACEDQSVSFGRPRRRPASSAVSSGRCVLPPKKKTSSRTCSASSEAGVDVAELQRGHAVRRSARCPSPWMRGASGRGASRKRRRGQRLVLDLDQARSARSAVSSSIGGRRPPPARPRSAPCPRASACSSWLTGRIP